MARVAKEATKPVKAGRKPKDVQEAPEVKTEVVGVEVITTNPEAFMYNVKADSKRYNGRTAEQVRCIVSGLIGCVKKIQIEKTALVEDVE